MVEGRFSGEANDTWEVNPSNSIAPLSAGVYEHPGVESPVLPPTVSTTWVPLAAFELSGHRLMNCEHGGSRMGGSGGGLGGLGGGGGDGGAVGPARATLAPNATTARRSAVGGTRGLAPRRATRHGVVCHAARRKTAGALSSAAAATDSNSVDLAVSVTANAGSARLRRPSINPLA